MFWILWMGLGGTGSRLYAHGPEGHVPAADTVRAGVGEVSGSSVPVENALNPGEALLAHPHNKLVHFPIAFALGALFLYLLAFLRMETAAMGADILVLLGVLSALLTVAAGWTQRSPFMDTPKEVWMLRHQWLGFATLIGYAVWAWGVVRLWSLRWKVGIGLIMALLVSVTAFLGGWVAHG